VYSSIPATPEKLWSEDPGKQLVPLIGGINGGGFPEYPGAIAKT
jgi:hypothetical protein